MVAEKIQVKEPEGLECAACTALLDAVEGFISSNQTVNNIISKLDSLCQLVPGFEAACDALVAYGVQEAIAFLQAGGSPQVLCTKLGLCSSMAVPQKVGDECENCQVLVGAVEQWLVSEPTEQQIIGYLDLLCNFVPAFNATCQSIVEIGVGELINWIQLNQNASVICSELGVCSSLYLPEEPLPEDPIDCQGCQWVVGLIEDWLAQNSSQQAIIRDLDRLCDLIPSLNQTCQAIFAYGVPEAIQWIQTNENPSTLCTQLSLCTSLQLGGAIECQGCKWLINAGEDWLAQNTSVAFFEKKFQQLCALVPSLESTCDAIVDQGVPLVVQWILQNEGPDVICSQLGICSSSEWDVPSDIVECQGCEWVVGLIEDWLSKNETTSAIIRKLDKLCDLIPGINSTCQAIVNAGVPTIINWIQQNENPTTICTQLGLCSSQEIPEVTFDSLECQGCQWAINACEGWLSQNSSITFIENQLTFLCNLVPSLETTCDAIIEQGVPTVVQWILQNESPQVVCTQLGICSSSNFVDPYISFLPIN